jgi:hypothetical protein
MFVRGGEMEREKDSNGDIIKGFSHLVSFDSQTLITHLQTISLLIQNISPLRLRRLMNKLEK